MFYQKQGDIMKTFFKLMTILFIFSFTSLHATAHVDDQNGNIEESNDDEPDTHQEVTRVPLYTSPKDNPDRPEYSRAR